MKDFYHISFTSHGEVLFRDKEDHAMFVNMLALHSFKEDAGIVADSEMSTHAHLEAICAYPIRFAANLKMSYYRWFNHKYGRRGPLGEEGSFILRLDGINHKMVATSYILRNGLHHGASSNAFGYEFCSIREMFQTDIGMEVPQAAILDYDDIAKLLPRRSGFPDNWRMDKNGMILRRDFMEIPLAESFYGTPRNFLFQMNRITDEKIVEDQLKDDTGTPITLSQIENVNDDSLTELLRNEAGRNFSKSKMQDLEVCSLIDNELIIPYGVSSVYNLSSTQRQQIAGLLKYDFHLSDKQISRCLPGAKG